MVAGRDDRQTNAGGLRRCVRPRSQPRADVERRSGAVLRCGRQGVGRVGGRGCGCGCGTVAVLPTVPVEAIRQHPNRGVVARWRSSGRQQRQRPPRRRRPRWGERQRRRGGPWTVRGRGVRRSRRRPARGARRAGISPALARRRSGGLLHKRSGSASRRRPRARGAGAVDSDARRSGKTAQGGGTLRGPSDLQAVQRHADRRVVARQWPPRRGSRCAPTMGDCTSGRPPPPAGTACCVIRPCGSAGRSPRPSPPACRRTAGGSPTSRSSTRRPSLPSLSSNRSAIAHCVRAD